MEESADDEDYYYLKQEMEKSKMSEIMNYLLVNSYHVNEYSTYELNKIIAFSGFNQTRAFSFLEKFTKDELFEKIDKHDVEHQIVNNEVKNKDITITNVPKTQIIKHKIVSFNSQSKLNLNNSYKFQNIKNIGLTHEKAWEFLSQVSSVVDIRELLLNHDHQKLMKKVKGLNIKDNKKINDICDNFFQEKIKKIKEMIFKASTVEDNDHYFLKNNDHGLEIKTSHFTCFPSVNYKNTLLGNLSKFESCFFSVNDNLKSYMLKFLDIFSIAKLGLVVNL